MGGWGVGWRQMQRPPAVMGARSVLGHENTRAGTQSNAGTIKHSGCERHRCVSLVLRWKLARDTFDGTHARICNDWLEKTRGQEETLLVWDTAVTISVQIKIT